MSSVLQHKNPEVYGDGAQVRCYTHSDDIAVGLAAVLENPVARNKTYNFGNPDQAVSILELAHRVIAALAPDAGLEVEMKPLPNNRVGREVRESTAEITLAQNELAYRPKVTLEEGLKRMSEATTGAGFP